MMCEFLTLDIEAAKRGATISNIQKFAYHIDTVLELLIIVKRGNDDE